MFRIKYLNKISPVGTSRFDTNYECGEAVENPDAIMVRSASMHEMEFPKNLLAIARAGAGVNNIPLEKCSEQGIVVFNTPGANANAVKELVIAALLLSSRKIVPAIEWTKTLKGKGNEVGKLVEKGKGAFVGPEISGKKLGVIGLGAIGILVANAAKSLGMDVYGYDPYLSVDAAWGLSRSTKHARTLDEIYTACDYITVHVPLTPDTKGMINEQTITKMKDGVRILNFARGDLVNSKDIIAALQSGKVSSYATDFPSDDLIGLDGVIAIPHLGASTPESEDNCARMAANELIDYLQNGNIRNSVNMPSICMPRDSSIRICILHRNIPNTISLLSGALAESGINIENMQSKSKKDYAYTILDVTGDVKDTTAEHIAKLPEIIRVRIIR
ncbi:3-phosphoglycerate dehydrogenase [Caproiciproducens galactitolivorans]|uniref:D-3-phosphoglycerate dehydrogenase n=1 Tax=Caproiciproducens galactitolivorans TaxID=642589 RepID=A0A4Z0YEN8_9FIRM|nr:phosphoglycerate dehydrogenase [Caproiciproducens galactitolivorans]QEY35651.1 3-phosphoglycerate dehydrogenase [Caproiciproducens galactitolivorans]TGJ77380.1 D-3-phosphoglycerate dehydrogenase [Caproiciproducens galactitolivorans]